MTLSPAVMSDCLRRHGLEKTTGVIAVSGGPDSVALAHLGAVLLQSNDVERLIFAHINHQLRGEESDADEAFVQNLGKQWSLIEPRFQIRTTRINMAALADAEGENLENAGRRERYRWLTQIAQEAGAAWVATGHSADDQAETVLFRLLRGAGLRGLGAMPECRALGDGVSLIRPLLAIRRHEIRAYLHQNQIPFCVDSSNRDVRFSRNRLRLDVMPMLEQTCNPAIVDVLCRLADQARELHDEITRHARQLLNETELPRAGDILVFAADRLASHSANAIREMFRLVWLRENWPQGEMDFAHWDRLADITQGRLAAFDFPGKIHARRVGRVVQVRRPR